MRFIEACGSAYGENIVVLEIELDDGEVLHKGDMIDIPLHNGTIMRREVKLINPELVGDFAEISELAAEWLSVGECSKSDVEQQSMTGACNGEVIVLDIDTWDIKTEKNPEYQDLNELFSFKEICLTPYKEIQGGNLSIYDYIEEGYSVSEKVITYLKTKKYFLMSLGIYEHPFQKGHNLLGPYWYTDGIYYWDRDTWKYVVKYGLKLPEDFINHVLSKEGDKFLHEYQKENPSWSEEIKRLKEQPNTLCLLPEDAGDEDLEDF